jgi:hypothetical protein
VLIDCPASTLFQGEQMPLLRRSVIGGRRSKSDEAHRPENGLEKPVKGMGDSDDQ